MKYEIKIVEDEKKLTVEDLFPKTDNLKAEEVFFDADGNKVDSIEKAVTSVTRLYDESGRIVQEIRNNIEKVKTK